MRCLRWDRLEHRAWSYPMRLLLDGMGIRGGAMATEPRKTLRARLKYEGSRKRRKRHAEQAHRHNRRIARQVRLLRYHESYL